MAEELKHGVESVVNLRDTCANCGREVILSSPFSSDYTFAAAGLFAKRGYHYWHHRDDGSYFCETIDNQRGIQAASPIGKHGRQNIDYKALYEQVIDKYEQLLFQLEELKREKNNLIGMQLPLPLVPVHE